MNHSRWSAASTFFNSLLDLAIRRYREQVLGYLRDGCAELDLSSSAEQSSNAGIAVRYASCANAGPVSERQGDFVARVARRPARLATCQLCRLPCALSRPCLLVGQPDRSFDAMIL